MPDKVQDLTGEEPPAEIGRLDARERGLRAQRRDITFRLEQIVRERERLQRNLDSSEEKSA